MMLLKIYIHKLLFLKLFIFSISSELLAQQNVRFNPFLHNNQSYNPAFVGLNQGKTLFILYREQWIGVEGAPKTQVFSYSSPQKAISQSDTKGLMNLDAKSKMLKPTKSEALAGFGFGIGVANDQIGPTSETTFDLDFSYSILISKVSKVAFGIKGSVHILDVNFNLLNPDNTMGMDPTLVSSINNQISPNIGVGILYYTNTFFIGLSAPSLLKTINFKKSSISVSQKQLHFYLSTGLTKDISDKIKIRYSLMIKALSGTPIQTNIGTSFLIADKVTLGFSYRLKSYLGGLLGYQFSNPFFVGLSYDKTTTNLGENILGIGSLGVALKYTFNKKNMKKVPAFLF